MKRHYPGRLVSPTAHRRLELIMRALLGIVATGFAVFLAWYEFGSVVFSSPLFWAILVFWLLCGYFVFWSSWDRTSVELEENIDTHGQARGTLPFGLLDDIASDIKGMRRDMRDMRDALVALVGKGDNRNDK